MQEQRDSCNVIADAAAARVVSWVATLATEPGDAQSVEHPEARVRPDLLEGARRDTDGFAFTRRLLEAVVGSGDPFSAALGLREVARELPTSMPVVERIAVRVGGLASLGLPWAVLPVARRWLRDRVSHLVLSTKLPSTRPATTKPTTKPTAEWSASTKPDTSRSASAAADALLPAGFDADRTMLSLGGLGVLGDQGAQHELRRLIALAASPEVQMLACDVARLVPSSGAGMWSLDHDAERGAARLRALLEAARDGGTAILVESSDYRGALLAPQLLVKALESPGLERVKAGVMLAAELPEAVQTAEALVRFSVARVAAGGEPLEVTVAVAGFSSKEQIESILTGLAVPAYEEHRDRAAGWLRVLAPLLRAGAAVRTVAASEDAHLLAAATVLAERFDNRDSLMLQLRAGTAPTLEDAIVQHGFRVRQRLPLVQPKEFSGAIEYLIALAAETADADSVLSHSRALLSGEAGEIEAGAARLREALRLATTAAPESRRVQRRDREWSEDARDTVVFYRPPTEQSQIDTGGLTAAVLGLTRADTGAITLEIAGAPLRVPVVSETGFAIEPDSDASRFDNRTWVRGLLSKARGSSIGEAAVREAVTAGEQLETTIDEAMLASEEWQQLRPAERGVRVGRLALGAASARDRLTEVLCAEAGAPAHVIDAEINGVIDATRYLGQLANGLGAVRGAIFHPDRVALVIADAGVPLAERAEAVAAALAAGSVVVLVAHPSIARSSAVLIEEWQAAGLPGRAVSLVVASEPTDEAHLSLAREAAKHTHIDRALVLGHRDTAMALLKRRPDLRVEGRFRATGVVVIAPSADPVRAARHAVDSAFGASAADASTARAFVLLGTANRSTQLRRAIVDVVESMPVGDTSRPSRRDPLSFAIGPLPEAPGEAGLRALTELAAGEEWLVKPEQLDDEGLLWRPGVRAGLTRDSKFWHDSVGMPVIGLISAHSVDEAISMTNRLGGGAVAGLHATDPLEILPWLERARAASLVVGRPTTGARIERQPFGAWGGAAMGGASLAGGPNRLQTLGSWEAREGTASATLHLRGLSPEVRVLIETSQASLDYQSFDRVRRAALSDALAWRTSFGRAYDVSGLGIERNLLRHWPVSTHVRLAEGAALGDLIRVAAAGLVAGAPMTVSTGVVLPSEVSEFFAMQGVTVSLERDEAWLERISVSGPGDEELSATRVRLIGGDRARTAEWLGGLDEVSLWAEPVTMAGPVELLTFVREQSVSITAHRHGLALLPAGVGGWLAEVQGRQ